tara:strand:+ start:206 stop:424 length:219 start_codon:yes stop_codon:yes gene_type:complete
MLPWHGLHRFHLPTHPLGLDFNSQAWVIQDSIDAKPLAAKVGGFSFACLVESSRAGSSAFPAYGIAKQISPG